MDTKKQKKFNWRAFVSLYVTFSFIIMVISGIVLYLSPAGRIAKWTHVYILGLEKESWQAIHIIFTFLFVIAGGFHIWYNWKPFTSYLRTKIQQNISLRKELFTSSLVVLFLLVATLANIPPFSTVIEFGETLTDSWATEQTEPPVPHAESMTFVELAAAIDKPVEGLMENLHNSGISANKNEIVKDVATRNDLTPLEVFEKMKTVKTVSPSSPYAGRGLGRKSLREVCSTLQLDLEKSIALLQESGIQAEAEMTLKDIAEKYDKKPVDLMEIINPGSAGH
ncbi:MAG: DUF4405 domain-containing protein [Deferribacteres bacterium]|nr:DUF4405 domain-containing protein [candidate division KSB1 bacterium]MCB9500696.1 DUF4405 domain-containing protein [Deferribacteres bacterium]